MRKSGFTKLRKTVSVFMAFSILYNAVFPTVAYALTGGPSQPEVQSFQPISTSDMVDLFSGDFKYNIPLLDVEGYPINLIYASNITMDQEASWVGLGWNINPGVVNRGVRGLPDDFKGEQIIKENNMKKNKTIGVNAGAGLELFGSGKLKLGISYSMGLKWNNYDGWGAEQSLNLSLSGGKQMQGPLSGGLGISSSSDEGLTISPRLSFSQKLASTENHTASVGVNVGSSYNSRGGLKTLSISANLQVAQNHAGLVEDYNKAAQAFNDMAGEEVIEAISEKQTGSMSKSFGARFDFTAPTYSPQITLPMKNFSASGSFKVGGELWGVHPNGTIGGYYSSQALATTSQSNPAYGYIYAHNGTSSNAVLDFNREKDGPYTESTPALPLANFTNDMFSVSGQGTGGSYRAFRSDVGTVYDAESGSTSDGFSLGGELGLGNLGHIGVDLTVNIANTHSGKWTSGNAPAALLSYKGTNGDPLYEPSYFKEANEKTIDSDPTYFQKLGGSDAVAVKLKKLSKFDVIATNEFRKNDGSTLTIPSANYRTKREVRNQMFSYLLRQDVPDYGLQNYPSAFGGSSLNHHIGEITTLGNDGKRYVYGIPAYNIKQEEISFAASENAINPTTGLVQYSGSDNSTGNSNGTDNFYSKTSTPAYAHAYLLTSVLSPDYVDNDNTRGPSDQDYGSWVKFSWEKMPYTYKWRTPYGDHKASANQSLLSQTKDDKGNIVYGEKELHYLKVIETKNYKALFYTSARHDAKGVNGVDGGIATSQSSMKLDKIELFNKHDMTTPIKTVYFEYDYSLCPGVFNNDNVAEVVNGSDINANHGKLTLKKVYFTYESSNKGRFSPYKFEYCHNSNATNYPYMEKRFDRWGNYKGYSTAYPIDPGPDAANAGVSPIASPTEFPYVEQDQASADLNTQAWALTDIYIPSGGKIQINYESDDYAYVQNKQAMQMVKIAGLQDNIAHIIAENTTYSQSFASNDKLMFKRLPGTTTSDYVSVGDLIYFKFLINIRSGNHEYVPGYATVGSIGTSTADPNYSWITLSEVTLNDNGGGNVNPIAKTGIQYGRIYLKKLTFNDTAPDDAGFGIDFLNTLLGASFIGNTIQAIKGINKSLWDQGVAREAIMNKSWVRLKNPNGHKLGGGSRVKSIVMNDNWHEMTGNEESDQQYGQTYEYKLPDGKSSGVAVYEPLLGGDENPWKQPVFYEAKKLMAPDDRFYMEEPFGESFFPGAAVGYSRVTVKNLPQQANLARHGTGSTVHDFYTAYDFPTITDRTTLDYKRGKSDPWSLSSIFSIDVKDFVTVSQGYVIELNDMHGKPKSQTTYQEGNSVPISKVTYKYRSTGYGPNSRRLVNNNLTLINPDGTVTTGQNAQLGVFFDAVYDTREATSESMSPSIGVNLDFFYIPPFFFPFVPMIWPGFSNERTQFRSGVVTKVVQRFGILEETIAEDLGSSVSTKPLAYDSNTGEPLVTQTITNYNDSKYSMTFPGYWYYKSMGLAANNLGVTVSGISFTLGVSNVIPNVTKYFSQGDEVKIGNSPNVGWVTDVSNGKITVVNKNGTPAAGSNVSVTVLRSGYRNVQTNNMATMTLLSNPLNGFAGNSYQAILEASAIEYKNGWKTYCDCPGQDPNTTISTNPYINGTRGVWRPSKSYAYLTGRTISNYDNNTNLRKDGTFTSFSPLYKISSGNWVMDTQGWTYASEVTEFDPFGQEIENKDALGRFSAATYGYNQSLATAVASNSRFRDIGVDNFEDYNQGNCADNHFKFQQTTLDLADVGHTGKKSIRVQSNNPAILERQITECSYDPCNGLAAGAGTANTNPAGTLYTIAGGTPGGMFEYSWQSTSGSPNFQIQSGGHSILMYSQGPSTAIITVTDPLTGCKVTINGQAN